MLHMLFDWFLIAAGIVAIAGMCKLILKAHGSQPVTESPAVESPPPPPADPPDPEPPQQAILIGDDLDSERPLLWPEEHRNRHLYILGKTRTGKTTFLHNLMAHDIEKGNGFALVDPAGDAAEDVLRRIPPERVADTIYLNAADTEHPVSFNILDRPHEPQKLTEDVIAVFRNFTAEGWGPRMEHLLRYALFTLLIAGGGPYTIAHLKRLLLDEAWRRKLVATVRDDDVRLFWEVEFADMPSNAAGPILNKMSAFLLPGSPIRAIITQPRNRLNMRDIMDSGKILVANLAKGVIGDEPAKMIGGLIVAAIQQEALSRAARPASERRDFFLYVDEFQNFAVPSFATILAESAKYRLNLTLANQVIGQVPGYLQELIFGNVGTLVSFQVSADDARTIQKEMHRTQWVTPKEGIPLTRQYLRDRFGPDLRYIVDKANTSIAELDKKTASPAYADRRDREVNIRLREDYQSQLNEAAAVLHRIEHEEPNPPLFAQIAGLRLIGSLFRFDDRFEGLDFLEHAKKRTYPDLEDFVNLPPHTAFFRAGKASDVCKVKPLPPPAYQEHAHDIREEIRAYTVANYSAGPAAASPDVPPSGSPDDDDDNGSDFWG